MDAIRVVLLRTGTTHSTQERPRGSWDPSDIEMTLICSKFLGHLRPPRHPIGFSKIELGVLRCGSNTTWMIPSINFRNFDGPNRVTFSHKWWSTTAISSIVNRIATLLRNIWRISIIDMGASTVCWYGIPIPTLESTTGTNSTCWGTCKPVDIHCWILIGII